MKLLIEIDMENEAFENDKEAECVRIFEYLAWILGGQMTLDVGDKKPIRDVNGNSVGTLEVI